MYKENFVDFELPDPELVEQLKAEYKTFMTPETLAQIEDFKKSISNNKEHFDYLKEMYEQLRSELSVFLRKEKINSREFTEDQFEKEFESFQESDTYVKLSESVKNISVNEIKIPKDTLVRLLFALVFFTLIESNSPEDLIDIFEILFNFFKTTPEYVVVLSNVKNLYDFLYFISEFIEDTKK